MMTTSSNLSGLRWLLTTGLAVLALLVSAQQAQAGSAYLTTLNTLYNTAGTPLDNCGLCHSGFADPIPGANPGGLNPFGAMFKGDFVAIESLLSDGDATSNRAEINAGFFPGWDCNTYTSAGGTLPAGFVNRVDPDNIGCMSNLPPVANINGPYYGSVDLRVYFKANGSSDPDGTVVQYDWDFGDGTTAPNTGPIPSHTYLAPGNYTITLTVTDDAGATAAATSMAFIVAVPADPIADPTGPYDGIEGVALTLDGGRSFDPDGGQILTYFWDFGDGNMGIGVAPNHTYGTAGTYTVSLIVTDDEGFASKSATTTATIRSLKPNAPPVSDPKGSYTASTGQPVSFDGSGASDPDGTIVTYDWDFGDGSSGTGVSPTHTYQAAGTYKVSLTVTDDGGLAHTASTTAVIGDALRLLACEGISLQAEWKSSHWGRKYQYWGKHRKGDDDEDDEHESEHEYHDYWYGNHGSRRGRLIVTGRGQPGSKLILSNADAPEQIMASRHGRTGGFAFSISGEWPSSVPCRVQVDQPGLQLCGQAEVVNAPANCGTTGSALPPIYPGHHERHWDHD
ncbi:MAG: PKD domain-containing protein [Gammaproteobacteria bacterium]